MILYFSCCLASWYNQDASNQGCISEWLESISKNIQANIMRILELAWYADVDPMICILVTIIQASYTRDVWVWDRLSLYVILSRLPQLKIKFHVELVVLYLVHWLVLVRSTSVHAFSHTNRTGRVKIQTWNHWYDLVRYYWRKFLKLGNPAFIECRKALTNFKYTFLIINHGYYISWYC